MFDIGLLELFLVVLVSLIILGPNRLPEVVKSSAKTLKWFKKIVENTKREISVNIGLDQIYQDIHNEEILKDAKLNDKSHSKKEGKA
ncbi:MAG TPA: twin-arginine translocase subunit TatB [Gammaproteobacteria bacterium]|jgi:sec-independent protein translocase protein TatB|nr:twin-arginine translocase subunit TatB [Gammaproteobacteria bacterium]HIK72330.1 twin-arginine translocase subunit TatB [Gammaproteobacteria bacterium]